MGLMQRDTLALMSPAQVEHSTSLHLLCNKKRNSAGVCVWFGGGSLKICRQATWPLSTQTTIY